MASQLRVARELLPAPLPFATNSPPGFLGRLSRPVQRRVQRRSQWQEWRNQGVEALNALYSPLASVARFLANDSQQQCLALLAAEYRKLNAPPSGFSAAGACEELCGRPMGYSARTRAVPGSRFSQARRPCLSRAAGLPRWASSLAKVAVSMG